MKLVFLCVTLTFFTLFTTQISSMHVTLDISKNQEQQEPLLKHIKEEEKEEKVCSICLSSIEQKEIICIVPCAGVHQFHKACIDPWFLNNTTCPLCREDLAEYIQKSRTCFQRFKIRLAKICEVAPYGIIIGGVVVYLIHRTAQEISLYHHP